MRRNRLVRVLAIWLMGAFGLTLPVVFAAPAQADGCYTWNRTLREGTSGADVTRLQIRIAGWMTSGTVLSIDGKFGPGTTAALKRFQSGYGLANDGVAGPATFSKIYALQDNDCSPAHFDFTESNNCGLRGDFRNGMVSEAQARENFLRAMWKAEAIRHKRGDKPMQVTSGFRSRACNAANKGSSTSRHMYGDAIDFGGTVAVRCDIARVARTSGFTEILGQGYNAQHNNHTHAASGTSRHWSFPSC